LEGKALKLPHFRPLSSVEFGPRLYCPQPNSSTGTSFIRAVSHRGAVER
jgi:hypothetical protein